MAAANDALGKLRERSGHHLDEAPGADAIAVAMRAAGIDELAGVGSFTPQGSGYALHTFGAVFVEIGFDPELAILRLRRVVGRYSVGKIINPRTARAQILGGIAWGWGKATMEASRHEKTPRTAALQEPRLASRCPSTPTYPRQARLVWCAPEIWTVALFGFP